MISSRFYGSAWLQFPIKQFGGLVIFWIIVWVLHLAVYGPELIPLNYAGVSLLVPAAAMIEILFREKRMRLLGGLSRCQLWNLAQREILFVLVAIFGVIVMSRDDRFSRLFLGVFFVAYAFWVTWVNLVGHRLMQRLVVRQEYWRRARQYARDEQHSGSGGFHLKS